MELQEPRTWDDEMIDAAIAATITRGVAAALPGGTLAALFRKVDAEAARRAEIRIERVYGGIITAAELVEKHDASWYDSRQTEQQWLQCWHYEDETAQTMCTRDGDGREVA
jgi:hypothetical protein